MSHDPPVQIRISPELKGSWADEAARRGLTLSEFVRRCVNEELALTRALRAEKEQQAAEREQRLALEQRYSGTQTTLV